MFYGCQSSICVCDAVNKAESSRAQMDLPTCMSLGCAIPACPVTFDALRGHVLHVLSTR